MANKEPGYVYILTNPSFREDWVKIGKSTNMEKRLKTLNTTALPLPFKVYATIKASKYEGRLWSLSAFCGTYIPENMHNASEAYQGPKYFSYQGKTLWEIRLEKETEC